MGLGWIYRFYNLSSSYENLFERLIYFRTGIKLFPDLLGVAFFIDNPLFVNIS